MIKFVMAAAWIVAVAIGSVYYSFNLAQSRPAETPPAGFFGGLDYVRTDVISVPILEKGRVLGYFLGRLVFTAEGAQLKKLVIPPETLLTDQLYSYLYANPQIDFTKRGSIDIDAIRNGIRDSVNARLGVALVHEVLVEQFDFLTKDDIRDSSGYRRSAEEPDADAAADAGGH